MRYYTLVTESLWSFGVIGYTAHQSLVEALNISRDSYECSLSIAQNDHLSRNERASQILAPAGP